MLPVDSSSACWCVLPAPLARAIQTWPDTVLTTRDRVFLLSSAPIASPSLQVFQESASCFLALLLELLAEPGDSERRLCQQSLLVSAPLCLPSPHSFPQGQKMWGWAVSQGECRLRALLPALGSDAFLPGQAVSPTGVFWEDHVQKGGL